MIPLEDNRKSQEEIEEQTMSFKMKNRSLAHESLSYYLDYLKSTLNVTLDEEQRKKLMVLAYQGPNLKYNAQ
ncbi:hypothetical protein ABEB36_009021 [Hypothenemus hampei]|uniref:Uncharacterized protein n=1 Tax=Hypothenemus hampei TaxID=57062 RepID=A0ABD1ENV9_HYPHA